MFDAMADWMTVPLLQEEAGVPPQRMGLAHTSISPYGAFSSRDGVAILISIQSDREWRVLAEKVLGDAALAADPAFATNVERVKRRAETDGRVAKVFASLDADALEKKLAAADIAFARVNSPADLARHPHLRRITHRHAERAGVLSGAGGARRGIPALRSGAGARPAYRAGARGIHGGYNRRKVSGRSFMDIGFIGLGNMGAHMARRLVEAGHKVIVYDTRQEAIGDIAAIGGVAARSPKEVADAAETVMVSLPTPDIVLKVATGPGRRDRRQARAPLRRSVDHRIGDGAEDFQAARREEHRADRRAGLRRRQRRGKRHASR